MSRKINPPDKSVLENLYLNQIQSPNQIASDFSVSRPVVLRWLRHHSIEIRDHKKASDIVGKNQIGKQRSTKLYAHQMLSDKEWLYNVRVLEKKSHVDIGKILDCSESLVRDYLIKHDIIIDRIDLLPEDIVEKLTKDNLENLYIKKRFTLRDVSKEVGCSVEIIRKYLRLYNINPRESNEYDRPFNKVSKAHQELIDYIAFHYSGPVYVNNRTSIKDSNNNFVELDIYLPEKNFAIEYNGLQWHTEEYKEGRHYHLNKTVSCQLKNIFLFHIWEDQWKKNSDVIKSMILNRIGMTLNKRYARNLSIKLVNGVDKKTFFDVNHIQGNCDSKVDIGLYENNTLISCMSFMKSRYNKNFRWELVRFANRLYFNVIGAFSKLLAHFIKNYGNGIVSYSDNCYSYGDVYEKNGFSLYHVYPPDYSYVDRNKDKRYNKRLFSKTLIEKKFGMNMSNYTESEAMKILGYKRIWDCGKKVWVLQ